MISLLLPLVIAAGTLGVDPPARTVPVLRHIVLYKFKDTTTPAQIDEVSAAAATGGGSASSTQRASIHHPVPAPRISQSRDTA